MKTLKKKRPKIDRKRALGARPEQLPAVKKLQEDGSLGVTVKLQPGRWGRWFGRDTLVERTFCLDSLGREVYEACNGKADVKTIVRRFASSHKISIAEAEMSVSEFLKTLMSKGLIAIAVDRDQTKG